MPRRHLCSAVPASEDKRRSSAPASGSACSGASAACTFCDTDFVGLDGPGGGRFAEADGLAEAVAVAWTGTPENRLVVLTGGEPLLQVDPALVSALHARGFEIAVETNGTQRARPLCCSTGATS